MPLPPVLLWRTALHLRQKYFGKEINADLDTLEIATDNFLTLDIHITKKLFNDSSGGVGKF